MASKNPVLSRDGILFLQGELLMDINLLRGIIILDSLVRKVPPMFHARALMLGLCVFTLTGATPIHSIRKPDCEVLARRAFPKAADVSYRLRLEGDLASMGKCEVNDSLEPGERPRSE